MPSRLSSLLATLRVANLPSVACNVWLGVALGVYQWGQWPGMVGDGIRLAAAGVLLCAAGNFLNDWHDREWDTVWRPERALPRGVFPPELFLRLAIGCGVAGMGLAAWVGWRCLIVAALIIACIVIYTKWHKRAIWTVVPLAMCRALLPVMAMPLWPVCEEKPTNTFLDWPADRGVLHLSAEWWVALQSWGFLSAHVAGVFCWAAGLSLVARYESMESPPVGPARIGKSLLFVPLVAMSAWWIPYYPLAGVIGTVPLITWLALCLTVFRHPLSGHVSALLAGIPLVDLVAMLPLTCALVMPGLTILDSGFLLATLGIPLVAFWAGRMLQRFAPAT